MKKNNLPKYWAVYNDGSDEFKKVVLPIAGSIADCEYDGSASAYYGFVGVGGDNGIRISKNFSRLKNNPTLLTIPEFAKLSQPIDKKYVLKEGFKHCAKTVDLILEQDNFIERGCFEKDAIISGVLFESRFKSLGVLDLWFKECEPIKPPKIGGIEPLIGHKTITYGDITFTFREIKRFYCMAKKLGVERFYLDGDAYKCVLIAELKKLYDFVMEEEGKK